MCIACVRTKFEDRARELTAGGWGVMGLTVYTNQQDGVEVVWDVVGWPNGATNEPVMTRYQVTFDK